MRPSEARDRARPEPNEFAFLRGVSTSGATVGPQEPSTASRTEIVDTDAGVVAFDWMGRQLVSLRTRAEDGTWGELLIHIADLGTGTLYEAATPAEFGAALQNGAIEEALDAQTFTEWRAANGVPTATLRFDECIEYDVPLFLGGDDTIQNMGVTDTSVLWTVVGQVRAQSLDLPEGSPVAVTPPSEG